jgi:hypothetical protein
VRHGADIDPTGVAGASTSNGNRQRCVGDSQARLFEAQISGRVSRWVVGPAVQHHLPTGCLDNQISGDLGPSSTTERGINHRDPGGCQLFEQGTGWVVRGQRTNRHINRRSGIDHGLPALRIGEVDGQAGLARVGGELDEPGLIAAKPVSISSLDSNDRSPELGQQAPSPRRGLVAQVDNEQIVEPGCVTRLGHSSRSSSAKTSSVC